MRATLIPGAPPQTVVVGKWPLLCSTLRQRVRVLVLWIVTTGPAVARLLREMKETTIIDVKRILKDCICIASIPVSVGFNECRVEIVCVPNREESKEFKSRGQKIEGNGK